MTERKFSVGQWAWSMAHQAPVRILEEKDIWGFGSYTVWVPRDSAMARLKPAQLTGMDEQGGFSVPDLLYRVAAARIKDALAQDHLIAPVEGNLIPLPHQLYALERAVSSERVRYLLADEVGLGKTIEAGLIIRELKLRGLVKRILVVAPMGLVNQWVREMKHHFGEEFQAVVPGETLDFRRSAGNENIWRRYDQVVCPVDSVKPVESRRGWSKEQLEYYNQQRFYNLLQADWDIIIIDEAHRLGGSNEGVARYKLGRALADVTPYLLLLTATPHQGKTDGFYRLLTFLDTEAFPNINALVKEQVAPYVIRTEKRRAVDAQGHILFRPRTTKLIPIRWEARHADQEELYLAVTDYVRLGYNQAVQEKKPYIGFLMVLLQRMVTSSTSAIRKALEKRWEILGSLSISYGPERVGGSELWELDSQELLDEVIGVSWQGLKNERAEVENLLRLAERCELSFMDAKMEKLLEMIHGLQLEENDEQIKVLVFTEFVATQGMLCAFLQERGFSVAALNGALTAEEREEAQRLFAGECQILVSTDAGGEGLNLQFCHVTVNYDLPWNPMRLEQRIGRVDRIGQNQPVKVYNFILADTVEFRVQEVLTTKLELIRAEFGVDKFGDVLDSGQAELDFTKAYVSALRAPDDLESEVETLAQEVREKAKNLFEIRRIMQGEEQNFAAGILEQTGGLPLGQWLETMTVNYLLAKGGAVKRLLEGYDLTFPDGQTLAPVTFGGRDNPWHGAQVLTLQEERIQAMLAEKHVIVPGQPVPVLRLQGLPAHVKGYWALWRIGLEGQAISKERMLPLFLTEEGKVFLPTARFIWDLLLEGKQQVKISAFKDGEGILDFFEEKVLQQGYILFKELEQLHLERLEKEKDKGELALRLRREGMARIGLKGVREYRLKQLAREEEAWQSRMMQKADFLPEASPVCLVFVEGEEGHVVVPEGLREDKPGI